MTGMVNRLAGFAVVLSMTGCSQGRAPGTPEPLPLGIPVEYRDEPGHVTPEIAAKAVDFRGTCRWARPAGAAESYRVRLRVRPGPSAAAPGTAIAVHADARFGTTDRSNVIGELPAGVVVLGDGPVQGGREHGLGYAILVRGHSGRVCRGYVSAHAVLVEEKR